MKPPITEEEYEIITKGLSNEDVERKKMCVRFLHSMESKGLGPTKGCSIAFIIQQGLAFSFREYEGLTEGQVQADLEWLEEHGLIERREGFDIVGHSVEN